MNLRQIIDPLVTRALEEGIITQKEDIKLVNINFDEGAIDQILVSIDDKGVYGILDKIFTQISQVLITKTRGSFIKTNNGNELIWDLLFSSYYPLNLRNKFAFKINIDIDDNSDIETMLSVFDSIYCIRTAINQIKSGLCLGTKHYLIDENEVTLISFAKKKNNISKWVEKGSFATIPYTDLHSFKLSLRRTAQDLIAKYYASH